MATTNPQLAILTHQKFLKDFVSPGTTETNTALMELKARGKIKYNQGGTKVVFDVRTAKHAVSNWGPMLQKNPTQPVLHKQAEVEWGGAYMDYFLDMWDKVSNENKPEALFSMQRQYLEALQEDYQEHWEDYFFKNGLTESPKGFGGLAAFVAATGTYATLSQTDASWKAQILSGASGTINGGPFKKQAAKYMTKITLDCTRGARRGAEGRPQAAFANRANWAYMHDDLEGKRRYITTNTTKLNMGHQNFVWDGVEYFWSDSATSAKVLYINWNYLEVYVATGQLAFEQSHEVPYPPGQLHQLFTKAQIICRGPRFFGKISATGIT